MDSELKFLLVFIVAVTVLVTGMLFGVHYSKEEKWEKLDNAGNCYLRIVEDESFGNKDIHTRETFCKESK